MSAVGQAYGQAPGAGGPPAAPAPPPPGSTDLLQEVVITGTQLHGLDAPIGSSLMVLDQNQIAQTGLQTTADLIRALPFVSQIGPGEDLTNSAANLGSLNITRAQGINLRGLGVQATLTLVDGRRQVPGGEGAQLFDPSAIPSIAVERIEIVPDGASATYGTDAVAGVVNLILRRKFDGVQIEASDGFANDFARQVRVGALAGHTWDGGSVMLAGEFFTHPELLASSRPGQYQDNQAPFGGSDLRNLVGAPGNISVGGTLYGLPPGNGTGVTPADFSPNIAKTSQWDHYSALPRTERHSFVLSAQQRVNDRVNLWLEGYFSERGSLSMSNPIQQTGLQVPSTNPFFIPAAAGNCTTGAGVCDSVNYSFVNDLGDLRIKDTVQSNQIALGADVDLGKGFTFEVYGTTNQDSESNMYGTFNQNALAAALADSNPATALNVFGSGGNNNPATLAKIYGQANFTSRYTVNLVNAKVDGPIFDLPAGSVRVAIGGEFHRDRLQNINYSNATTPDVTLSTETVNTVNSRSVSSGFVEAVVPVFGAPNAVPGIARLDIDLAGRYDRYSDFGSTTNPKIGLNWSPIGGLTVHGSYGKSFRAPTLCDINPFCTAGVITVPFPDLGWAANNPPSIFGPGVSLTAQVVGGNSTLKPETATTYSMGTDWHPDWISDFEASLDYYHIDYRNIIDAPAAFNPAAGSDPNFAQFVVRNPSLAQVNALFSQPQAGLQSFPPFLVNLIVDGRRHNVGEAITNGLDMSLRKTWRSSWGDWLTAFNGTYVFKYDYSVVPGAPLVDVVNTVQGSGNSYPLRFAARGQLGWSDYGFSLTSFINYHNSYTNTAPPTPLVTQSIASYTTVDLTAGYDTGDAPPHGLPKNLALSISAIDAFNRLPPFALIGTQTFDATSAGPLGRVVTFEVRKRF
jgi:iron complex outermembrane receptor protein